MGNIYERLQTCRVTLQSMGIKKSGKNTFAKYDYFELGDFLPHINRLFHEHRLFSQVTFTQDVATLTIIDMDKPEDRIVFTSPMARVELKAAHDIQNMGAVQTYQRRYLYMAALEIVEHDALDATQGMAPRAHSASPNGAKSLRTERTVQQALAAFFAAAGDKGIASEDAKQLLALTAWKRTGTYPQSSKDVPINLIDETADRVRRADPDQIAQGWLALADEYEASLQREVAS